MFANTIYSQGKVLSVFEFSQFEPSKLL